MTDKTRPHESITSGPGSGDNAEILKELQAAIKAATSDGQRIRSLVASLPESLISGSGLPMSIGILTEVLILLELQADIVIRQDNTGKNNGPGQRHPPEPRH